MHKKLVNKALALAVIGLMFAANFAIANDSTVYEAKIKTSAYDWQQKNDIETKLTDLDGVEDVWMDLDEKVVTVQFKESILSSDMLVYNIIELGYEAELLKVKILTSNTSKQEQKETEKADKKPDIG